MITEIDAARGTFQKLQLLSGPSPHEMVEGTKIFDQMLASGRLGSDDIRVLMQIAPTVVREMIIATNASGRAALMAMPLTSGAVVRAMRERAPAADEAFAKLPRNDLPRARRAFGDALRAALFGGRG